jgi:receptor protein-tyrosine kinase
MNTIEQAAKRLEQLRRAGVDVGMPDTPVASVAAAMAPETPTPTTPEPSQAPVEVRFSQDGAHATVSIAVDPALSSPQPSEQALINERRSREIQLDLPRMARSGLLIPGAPRSQLEEEFRIIKRPLLDNIRGQTAVKPHRANLVMVTSALPSEGKTQTAINLAISMAMELDHTVLLVEADVLRPSALARMGVQADHGLLDLLDGRQTTLPDVLLRTNIPKLTLLPAGSAHARTTELLASEAMNDLLEELASKYSDRVIIFDTPPLLPTTESRVLASHMGQVVMVVESNRTSIANVQQAYATLEDHPVVLGMLNKYRGPKSNNVYGYYAP